MSAIARQQTIVDTTIRHGECSVSGLAEELQVSEMTIRRDLSELSAQGKIIRTHGGAAPAGNVMFQFSFLERTREQSVRKREIAEKATRQVQDGMSVILDSGSTTLAIAQTLRSRNDLTVITTSLPIASELQYSKDIDVILLGGHLRQDTPDLAGALTLKSLAALSADIAFIGCDALDLDGNAYNASVEVAHLLAAMADVAEKTYLVADSSKIGRKELALLGNIADWNGLITDNKCPPEARTELKKQNVTLI